jgi:hypothetical protein
MPVYTTPNTSTQNAYVQYIAYNLATTTQIQLSWPTSYQDSVNVVAGYMQVTATSNPVSATSSLILPDATQVSVGYNFIIANTGGYQMLLYDNDNNLIGTFPTGTAWYYVLTTNSVAAGTWMKVALGAATSQAQAADLAGYGLNAVPYAPYTNSLNSEIFINDISTQSSPYVVLPTDYAAMLVYAGNGAISLTLPTVITGTEPTVEDVVSGYYVSINNAGGGDITIMPTDTGIQGQDILTLNPGQTVTVIAIADPIEINNIECQWCILGFNTIIPNVISQAVTALSGSVTLSYVTVSNVIQIFRGNITTNITVTFPQVFGQWYIYNQTTGTGSVAFRMGTGGTLYYVPQNAVQLFYGDGTNLNPIPSSYYLATATSPSVIPPVTGTDAVLYNAASYLTVVSSDPTLNGQIVINTTPAVRGNILIFDGTKWIILAPGTTDQVLTMNANGLPYWNT